MLFDVTYQDGNQRDLYMYDFRYMMALTACNKVGLCGGQLLALCQHWHTSDTACMALLPHLCESSNHLPRRWCHHRYTLPRLALSLDSPSH